MKSGGLCYRCEFRALFLENKIGPRMECQNIENSVTSCYMYRPVIPVILHAREGEIRPFIAPPMLAARSIRKGLADQNDFILDVKVEKNEDFVFFWRPRHLEIYSNITIWELISYFFRKIKIFLKNKKM